MWFARLALCIFELAAGRTVLGIGLSLPTVPILEQQEGFTWVSRGLDSRHDGGRTWPRTKRLLVSPRFHPSTKLWLTARLGQASVRARLLHSSA